MIVMMVMIIVIHTITNLNINTNNYTNNNSISYSVTLSWLVVGDDTRGCTSLGVASATALESWS